MGNVEFDLVALQSVKFVGMSTYSVCTCVPMCACMLCTPACACACAFFFFTAVMFHPG